MSASSRNPVRLHYIVAILKPPLQGVNVIRLKTLIWVQRVKTTAGNAVVQSRPDEGETFPPKF